MVTPLTPEQLAFRPVEHGRFAGELAAHIALGRIDWFHPIDAPGSVELAAQAVPFWKTTAVSETAIAGDTAQLRH